MENQKIGLEHQLSKLRSALSDRPEEITIVDNNNNAITPNDVENNVITSNNVESTNNNS